MVPFFYQVTIALSRKYIVTRMIAFEKKGGVNSILQNELPLYDGLDTLYWLMDTQYQRYVLGGSNS